MGVGDDAFGAERGEGADAVGAEVVRAFEGEDRKGPGDFDGEVGPAFFQGAAEFFVVGAHDHAVVHLVLIHQRDQAGSQVRGRSLHVQVDRQAGIMGQLQDLFQGRHRLAVLGAERPDLLQSHLADLAVAVGGAVNAEVVHDDEDAVFGELGIALDGVGFQLRGAAESGQSVFVEFAVGAAMGEDQGPARGPDLGRGRRRQEEEEKRKISRKGAKFRKAQRTDNRFDFHHSSMSSTSLIFFAPLLLGVFA